MSASPVGELRDLLGASHKDEVAELRARVAELESVFASWQAQIERTEKVADVLPAAVNHSGTVGSDLNVALRPQVIEALHATSRSIPDEVAEALFPVIGKAVRMIIANTFSPDSSAGYEVDEIFLMERLSGLPMLHIPRSGDAGTNSDVVAGML